MKKARRCVLVVDSVRTNVNVKVDGTRHIVGQLNLDV